MRVVTTVILTAVLLLSAGCTQVRPAGELQFEQPEVSNDQLIGFRDLLFNLQESVSDEPSADVADGLYLGYIASIDSVTSTPTVVVDFVTPEMQPGVTTEQRQKSSWPRYFGWNQFVHPQKLSLPGSAVVTSYEFDFDPVPVEAFAREVAADDDPDNPLVWCIAIGDGDVTAVWPWRP